MARFIQGGIAPAFAKAGHGPLAISHSLSCSVTLADGFGSPEFLISRFQDWLLGLPKQKTAAKVSAAVFQ